MNDLAFASLICLNTLFFALVGCVLGYLYRDMAERKRDTELRKEALEEMKTAIAKIALAHNNLTEQVKSAHDRLSSSELAKIQKSALR